MTRAALVVMSGDPLLNALWFRNYRTYAQHIDELHVLAYDVLPEHEPFMRDLAYDAKTMVSLPRGDHGVAIRYLFDRTKADTVLLLEDDAFVRSPGFIDQCFGAIERGETDAVGCPRGTGTPDIIRYANDHWGIWRADATGEEGPLLWPTFAFLRSEDLHKTDHNFSVWGGTTAFGQTFSEPQALDTFGWASLQLRANGVRCRLEANYRASSPDLLGGWTDAPWFHVGGLSVGHGLYFLGSPLHDPVGSIQSNQDLNDWEKRAAFWQIAADRDRDMQEYRDKYLGALNGLIDASGMDRGNIDRWKTGYQGLINW